MRVPKPAPLSGPSDRGVNVEVCNVDARNPDFPSGEFARTTTAVRKSSLGVPFRATRLDRGCRFPK